MWPQNIKKIIFNLKSIYVFSKVRLDAEQSKYFIADKILTYQCMIIGRIKRHLVAKRWHGETRNVQNDPNIAEHSVSPAVSNNILYLELDIINTSHYSLRLSRAVIWIWNLFFFIFENSDSAFIQRCDSNSAYIFPINRQRKICLLS